jgi:predicted Zn-ribbon and HTH transcriptional regulator
MPMIYEGRCSACEATTPRTSDGYLAVIVDHAPQDYRHPETLNMAILAHPLETLILEELGFTYRSATRAGRLVSVDSVLCRDCGRPFEIRKLTAGLIPAIGCLPVIILASIAGIIAAVQLNSLFWGCLWSLCALVLFAWMADFSVYRFVRWQHSERVKQVDTPGCCPHCHSKRYEHPGTLRGKVPCLKCGERAVTYRGVAIS